jgi:protein-S-isoprenylcysteine O-methyltransferase Ste14
LGIGPKIGIVLLPWLASAIILSCIKKSLFIYGSGSGNILLIPSSIIGYILFKIYIKKEYYDLEKNFGEDYIKYKSETPEFFPLLRRK